jgi:hypothetical protein
MTDARIIEKAEREIVAGSILEADFRQAYEDAVDRGKHLRRAFSEVFRRRLLIFLGSRRPLFGELTMRRLSRIAGQYVLSAGQPDRAERTAGENSRPPLLECLDFQREDRRVDRESGCFQKLRREHDQRLPHGFSLRRHQGVPVRTARWS